jgi:hypothetical protein
MRFQITSITILALFTVVGYAKDKPLTDLHTVRTLKCHFNSGTSARWTSTNPKTTPAYSNEDILIDSIDLNKHTARMRNDSFSVTSSIMINKFEVSFLDSESGVLMATAVFPIYSDNHGFIAIYTRHILSSGIVTSEQYFGTCMALS